MAVSKRSLPPSLSASQKRARTASSNPLGIKPLGNLLFAPSNTRSEGLGTLAILPDELLLSFVVSLLDGEDLVRLAGVSKAWYGWSSIEGIWKGIYISKSQGRLLNWHGSWRNSYIATFLRPSTIPESTPLPSHGITTPTLHSDVLFQPHLCAAFDPTTIFNAPSFVPTVPHLDGRLLTPDQLPTTPCIFTHLMDDWKSMDPTSSRRWELSKLVSRFPGIKFRAEATLTGLAEYQGYHDACEQDESPLYLFESEFVEKTIGRDEGLGDDYEVPLCFQEDLFEVMGAERPDYRWLIVGPTRSGSTWHQDPNSTSAWNAVTIGRKAWVMFPPSVTPPGVFVSADRAEVEAPLSLAEWFISYYKEAKASYGAKGKDPKMRGQMTEGICEAGEIFFVPSGYWHIVVNLEPSIAVTQNFVSRRELPKVLNFMKYRPEQVSGFKLRRPAIVGSIVGATEVVGGLDECDETVSGVYESFCEALARERGDLAAEVLSAMGMVGGIEEEEVAEEGTAEKGMWKKVTDVEETFSFGFFDSGGEDEEVEA